MSNARHEGFLQNRQSWMGAGRIVGKVLVLRDQVDLRRVLQQYVVDASWPADYYCDPEADKPPSKHAAIQALKALCIKDIRALPKEPRRRAAALQRPISKTALQPTVQLAKPTPIPSAAAVVTLTQQHPRAAAMLARPRQHPTQQHPRAAPQMLPATQPLQEPTSMSGRHRSRQGGGRSTPAQVVAARA